MISPLIVEEVRIKLVSGAHKTSGGLVFSAGVPGARLEPGLMVPVSFGYMDAPNTQLAKAADLRELAGLFTKMADALEQQ